MTDQLKLKVMSNLIKLSSTILEGNDNDLNLNDDGG